MLQSARLEPLLPVIEEAPAGSARDVQAHDHHGSDSIEVTARSCLLISYSLMVQNRSCSQLCSQQTGCKWPFWVGGEVQPARAVLRLFTFLLQEPPSGRANDMTANHLNGDRGRIEKRNCRGHDRPITTTTERRMRVKTRERILATC